MKLVKNSVAVVIKNEQGDFLVVKRPDDEPGALAGVWGFPAITLREGESEQDAATRVGRAKLGVRLTVGGKIGEKIADRGDHILHLSDYAASIEDNNLPSVPQADISMTQYTALQYAEDLQVLFPAAQRGSLCSQIYLQSVGMDWGN